MAEHFLSKYDDVDSLIWALDNTNLDLFIKLFLKKYETKISIKGGRIKLVLNLVEKK
jgi:hypothetical protein